MWTREEMKKRVNLGDLKFLEIANDGNSKDRN